MADAQRQQQYRRRKREAAYAAWDDAADGKLAQHSTPAVLLAMQMAVQQSAIGRSEADRALASTAVVDLAQELARRYARPNRDSDEKGGFQCPA